MKKKDIPQDPSKLGDFTREVCYVKNNDGKYETALSSGWSVKNDALDNAWDDINNQIEVARKEVIEGRKSPIYFYFIVQLMDFSVLTGYTGFWKNFIKKHMTPKGFARLNKKKLETYAKAFDISVEELIDFKG